MKYCKNCKEWRYDRCCVKQVGVDPITGLRSVECLPEVIDPKSPAKSIFNFVNQHTILNCDNNCKYFRETLGAKVLRILRRKSC